MASKPSLLILSGQKTSEQEAHSMISYFISSSLHGVKKGACEVAFDQHINTLEPLRPGLLLLLTQNLHNPRASTPVPCPPFPALACVRTAL